jgi:serine/threonine protein kinase
MAGPPSSGVGGSTPTVGLVGDLLGGRYELLRPLARGGMAEVWEAKDNILDRSVAAKILYPHLAADSGFRARFKREAVSAARLNHPAIVTVFDTGIDDANAETGGQLRAYIIMEMVPGRTLRALMSEGSLDTDDVVAIIAQAADGLAYAHNSGFVHRDVKPANIMVQPDGRVKVADFGIAKTLQAGPDNEDLTQAGAILGTAKYLSPEQVDGSAIDARSDIYSLGVVLYEGICGRPPFIGSTDLATAMLHVNGTTQRPRNVQPDISRSLERVVMRAMAREPEDRFQKASELARALRDVDSNDAEEADYEQYAPPATGSTGTTGGTGSPRSTSTTPADDFTDDELSDLTPTPDRGIQRPASPQDPHDVDTVLMDERTKIQRAPQRPVDRPSLGAIADAKTAESWQQKTDGYRPSKPTSNAPKRSLAALAPIALIGALLGGGSGWFAGNPTVAKLQIAEVRTFDPLPGDGREKDQLLPNLTDTTSSAWTTETYGSGFTGLNNSKRGVGVIFDLGSSRPVASLQVASLSAGWNAEIYVADQVGDDLASWKKFVKRYDELPEGTVNISTKATGRYVMLWVADLGPNTNVSIAEVVLFG